MTEQKHKPIIGTPSNGRRGMAKANGKQYRAGFNVVRSRNNIALIDGPDLQPGHEIEFEGVTYTVFAPIMCSTRGMRVYDIVEKPLDGE